MAKKVKATDVPRDGRFNHAYKWDEWLDGEWWKLSKGEDFFNDVKCFRAYASSAGSARGFKVTTRVVGDSTVYIKANPKE